MAGRWHFLGAVKAVLGMGGGNTTHGNVHDIMVWGSGGKPVRWLLVKHSIEDAAVAAAFMQLNLMMDIF